ncbi:MAG TPA: thioredoxin domain-containing protein [Planctomycetaceae bacterium]|nr:thioredoxin domain-containing protein [Planctomycetaceae bacterium]
MMLSRLLLTLTVLTRFVPGALIADDDSTDAKCWIIIGPNNVIVANHPIQTQKLIDESNESLLLVSCREYQFPSDRIDGKPHMKLECEHVSVVTSDDDNPEGQTTVTAEKLRYDSAIQTLDFSGKVSLKRKSNSGQVNFTSESLQLKLSGNDLQIDVSEAKVRLESKLKPEQSAEPAKRSSALFFTAPWCGPCQTMQPIISKLRSEGYSIESINVDGMPEEVKQYKVTAIPQIIVLDGKSVRERVNGIKSLADLKRILDRDQSKPAPPPMPAPARIDHVSKTTSRYHAPSMVFDRPSFSPIMQTKSSCIEKTDASSETDSVQLLSPCKHCPACPQRSQESSSTYQSLIPELFNAELRFTDPNQKFRFGWIEFTR